MSSESERIRLRQLQAQQSDSLDQALKREKASLGSDTDCLSCRIMGSTAFAGLGVYSYLSGHRELSKQESRILRSGSRIGMPARRLGVTFTSAVLVGLGLYRYLA